ncbi:uncharacterized protein LOC122375681 [Amphibalanus amphitrite]|uniref:uncharacterized protein LOC122375681 n=1 Tax=Amphibalanus amphitrite TaxID=1232801 RepID=UPI001C9039ED|nr:uncharacterized protein LOC122375681 [Amphibalanus amphitrite]
MSAIHPRWKSSKSDKQRTVRSSSAASFRSPKKSNKVQPAWHIPQEIDKLTVENPDGSVGDDLNNTEDVLEKTGHGLGGKKAKESGNGTKGRRVNSGRALTGKRAKENCKEARERNLQLCMPLVRWMVHFMLLILLAQQLHSQYQVYRSQPVTTTIQQTLAPFPRITLCPGSMITDTKILSDAEKDLKEGKITLDEFYNRTTLEILETYDNSDNYILLHSSSTSYWTVKRQKFPEASKLGHWQTKYYLTITEASDELNPTRCLTLQPSKLLMDSANENSQLEILLKIPSVFSSEEVAYRLYVHDTEEPNVGDLLASELGSVHQTTSVNLPAKKALSMRLTARQFNLANVWRRPCRQEPGYSAIQCLKECLWHRLAANISCRLPHMVHAKTYLPDMSGPLDHLPLCTRTVQMKSSEERSHQYMLRLCKTVEEECVWYDEAWYRPSNLEPQEDSWFAGFLGLRKREVDPATMDNTTGNSENPTPSSKKPAINAKDRAAGAKNPATSAKNPATSAKKPRSRAKRSTTQTKKPTSRTKKTNRRTPNTQRKFARLDDGVPTRCPRPEEFHYMLEDSLLTKTHGCDCPPACHQTSYHLSDWSLASSNTIVPDNYGTQLNSDQDCQTKLTLAIDLSADEVNEDIVFTLPTLLANVGGTVGIVTGYSLFTLAEVVENLVWRLGRK